MSAEKYEEMIRWKKQEFHANGWNALDMNVKDVMKAFDETKVSLADCAEGMKRNMLEGDSVIFGDIEHPDENLTVRYYCDNLSESRKQVY